MNVKYVLRGSMSGDSHGFLSRVSVSSPEAGTQESAAHFRLCLLRTAGEKDPNRRGHQEPPDNGEVWAPRASCTGLLTRVHTGRQEVYTDPQRRFVSTCALDGKKSRACLRVIKKFWGHRTLLLYLTPKTIAKFHSALWNTTNFDRTIQRLGMPIEPTLWSRLAMAATWLTFTSALRNDGEGLRPVFFQTAFSLQTRKGWQLENLCFHGVNFPNFHIPLRKQTSIKPEYPH